MEGPSLVLAREQLKPFVGERIRAVSGSASLDLSAFEGTTVKSISTWGKHLIIQFDTFALKVHFLLFGTYDADVEGLTVNGDYARTSRPELTFRFRNGELRMYNCSLTVIDGAHVIRTYDRSVDTLSRSWDAEQAVANLRRFPDEEIADVLMDQNVFAGVGNIIKNEVLSIVRIAPRTHVRSLGRTKRKEIVAEVVDFAKRFLRWRRANVLTKHLKVHKRTTCPHCGGPLVHEQTGKKKRRSHYCPKCQKAG